MYQSFGGTVCGADEGPRIILAAPESVHKYDKVKEFTSLDLEVVPWTYVLACSNAGSKLSAVFSPLQDLDLIFFRTGAQAPCRVTLSQQDQRLAAEIGVIPLNSLVQLVTNILISKVERGACSCHLR